MIMASGTHSVISPAILYWGTPGKLLQAFHYNRFRSDIREVVLITTQNEDDTSSNIAPMSSAWWLGHSCMLGLDATSKTTQNLLRTKECVLNLASEDLLPAVNALADTTGSNPVSASKASRNYKFVKDKWTRAQLSPKASDFVQPARIAECLVQMECELLQVTNMRPDLPDRTGLILAIEVRVLRIHILDELRMEGYANRVDPDKWKPLIMNFQEFYGLKTGKVGSSV